MLWSGGLPRWAHLAGRGIVIAVILAAPVAVHVAWVRAADAAWTDRFAAVEKTVDRTTLPSDAPPPSEADAAENRGTKPEQRYQAADAPRAGHTVVRIEESSEGAWKAVVTHDLTLRLNDPMATDLRSDAQDLETLLPYDLTVAPMSGECPGIYKDSFTDWLEQRSHQQAVHAFSTSELEWSDNLINSCGGGSTAVTVTMKKGWQGTTGLYQDWTLAVEAPLRPPTAVVGGDPLSQSADRVELRLPERGKIFVQLGEADPPERAAFQASNDIEALFTWLQNGPPPLEAVLLLAGVTAVTCCWAVPFISNWAQAAARRRWITLARTAGVLTCATFAYCLIGGGHALWWAAHRGQLLVLWWWVLLPFLVGALAIRAARGRPPRTRDLLPMLLPSILLLVPVAVLCATGQPLLALAPVLAAIAAAVLTALALRRGVLGQAGRRWKTTLVAAAWWAALTAGPGTGLPDTLEHSDYYSFVVPWAVSNQIAGFTLRWVWLAMLCTVLAAFVWRMWLALAVALAFWCALTLPSLGGSMYEWDKKGLEGPWAAYGVDPEVAANAPLTIVQSIVLCAALLLLRRYSRREQQWPAHVRTAVLLIGIAAAATPFTLTGFSYIVDPYFSGGIYLTLLLGALGFAWLLPRQAERRATRLNNTSPRAHSRRMHALLKDQAMAAGRREFVAFSRAGLASGELTTTQWSARWRELGGLGGQRYLALRQAALGTSGGRGAWGSGVAAAGLLAVLSLPWFILALPAYFEGLHVLEDMPGVVDALSYAARWPLYGFIYGYAYSWLRGPTPLAKAMCLLVVVLPVELVQLLEQDVGLGEFGARLLLSTGNCLAAFLILGLFWEARLVRSAGVRWGQIRNFRTLSALAVPVTTVFVAVATAMATAIIGVWISPSGPSPADPPKLSESVTESPTPRSNQ